MLEMILAVALQSSSTNCYPIGNTVQCDTYGSPPAATYPPSQQQQGYNAMQGLQAFQMGREARRQEEAYRQPQTPPAGYAVDPPAHYPATNAVQIFREQLARRMNTLIETRRCEDSYNLARLAGELEMAQNSLRYCPIP